MEQNWGESLTCKRVHHQPDTAFFRVFQSYLPFLRTPKVRYSANSIHLTIPLPGGLLRHPLLARSSSDGTRCILDLTNTLRTLPPLLPVDFSVRQTSRSKRKRKKPPRAFNSWNNVLDEFEGREKRLSIILITRSNISELLQIPQSLPSTIATVSFNFPCSIPSLNVQILCSEKSSSTRKFKEICV
jgi:hypothetical protein